jgi:hypothetical protein
MNRKENIKKVCEAYEAVYFRAHGNKAEVRPASSGWYHIYTVCPHTGSMTASRTNYRLTDFEALISRLEEWADNLEAAATREGFVVVATPAHESRNLGDWFFTEDDKWTSDIESPSVKVYELSSEADEVARMKNKGLPFKYVIIRPFKE